jgi:hypothetical protein
VNIHVVVYKSDVPEPGTGGGVLFEGKRAPGIDARIILKRNLQK